MARNRFFLKRLNRLTLCFSKKLENLEAAFAMFAAYTITAGRPIAGLFFDRPAEEQHRHDSASRAAREGGFVVVGDPDLRCVRNPNRDLRIKSCKFPGQSLD